jgi:predicted nucleic acid-binding protein
VEFLDRFNPLVRDQMKELLRRGEVATSGLVLAELRRGARSPAQVAAILEAINPLLYLEADQGTWLHAGELATEGASRGRRLEIGDCLLAALALREGCLIFTLDRDFEHIPGVKLYRIRPS